MKTLEQFWETFPDEDSHFLKLNGATIAVVQPADTEGKYCIYQYDTDWQQIYLDQLGNCLPEFDNVDKAKRMAEEIFHKWFRDVNEQISDWLFN